MTIHGRPLRERKRLRVKRNGYFRCVPLEPLFSAPVSLCSSRPPPLFVQPTSTGVRGSSGTSLSGKDTSRRPRLYSPSLVKGVSSNPQGPSGRQLRGREVGKRTEEVVGPVEWGLGDRITFVGGSRPPYRHDDDGPYRWGPVEIRRGRYRRKQEGSVLHEDQGRRRRG